MKSWAKLKMTILPSALFLFAGIGWYGLAQDCSEWRWLCDSALSAASSFVACLALDRHTLVGPLPATLTSTLVFVYVCRFLLICIPARICNGATTLICAACGPAFPVDLLLQGAS
eukprot:357080-Chlamydomonas_euryale.AAC.4